MNRTVKVTGFSLRSTTRYELSDLFSRVGQVQKVYLSPDKNAAFVRFEYQTAVDFVLDQEWRLGGESLKVRPVISSRKDSSPARVPVSDPDTSECLEAGHRTYCYNDYILTQNKYWIDCLHEGAGTVVCKKKKRKRKYSVCGNVSFPTCAPHEGKRTKKVKKHRKQKKKCAYLESAASLPFGINTCVSKEKVEVFLKGSGTIPLSVPIAVTAKDFLAVASEATKVPPQLLHITFNGTVLSDKAVEEIQGGSTFHYSVKGLGGADSGEAELERKQKAENLKVDGNKMYKEGKYTEAAAFYTASIAVFPLTTAYNNRAMCYLYLSKWEEAIQDCNQVLQVEPENMKALLRRGKAKKSQGNFDQAKHDLTSVQEKGTPTLSQQATSHLKEIETDQMARLSSNEDQVRSMEQGGALSKSAKKRLKRKAMEKRQEGMEEVQKESAADSVRPECTANESLDPEKVTEDGDQELATDQATKSSSKVGRKLTDGGDASLNIQPSGPHTDQYTVCSSSSAEEVQCWLQYTCGLTEKCLHQLEGLDGEVLFEYGDGFSELVRFTNVPTGVARKIFFLRDNPSCQSKILTWSVEEVIQFVEGFIEGQDWSKVKENQIDGPAFLSYKMVDTAEVAEDFKVKKMIAFHILKGKQNILDGEEKENTDCPEPNHDHFPQPSVISASFPEAQDTFTAVASPTPKEVQSMKCVKLEKDDPFTQYKLFLQDALHLQPLESDSKQLVKCEINVMYHKRKDLNRLEQQFMFLILCKPDFCRGKSAKSALEKLWTLIIEKVPSHWVPLLPPDALKNFCLENNKVLFNGKSLCFDNQSTKVSNIIEFNRSVRKLDQCTLPIMIIDRKLLEEKSCGYILTLKQNKQANSFPFGFDNNKHYWLFDSLDFGWGFNSQKVNDSALGTLPRCIYRDSADTGKLSSDVCAEREQPCHQNAEEQKREQIPQLCPQNVNGEEHEQSPADASSKEIPPEMPSSQTDEGVLEEESSIASANLDQMKPESEEAECSESAKYVNPRPFKKQVWRYSQGILRAIESGDNMLSRAVEFKLQAGCPPDDPKAFRSFLYKSLEFVCACLNARKNGTIYFGIAEKPIGEQIFRYGEICGIDMDQSLCAKYYDAFYSEFLQKCFPSCFELVKLCLTGPQFVPVEKTNKYVIEIDVEPTCKQTKQRIFHFEPGQIYEKYGPPKQTEKSAPGKKKEEHVYLKNQNRWTGIFRRDGSETKYIGESQTEVFEVTILPEICKKRQEEEDAEAKAYRVDMNSPEAEKLKQFIAECDSSMFPILLLPKLSEEEERKSVQFFEFLHYIRWSAIFDFDNESERRGIYSFAKSSNLAFEVHESIVNDFNDMSIEDRKDHLSFPKKTVWLFTNGKTTGSNAFQRLEQKEWENCYWTFIQNAVAFYKDNSVIAPVRRLVLILINKNDAGIMETSRDIKTAFGWRSVFFVFQDESERQIFAKELSHDIIEHSVVMPWKHVHHVICQCLKLKSQDEDKYVHTSSGALVPVPFNEWQSWGDLEVLSVSECQREWDALTPEQRNKKAKEEEMKFYQGKPVSWWNFYLTKLGYNHVMDRTIRSKLINHIEDKIKITERDSDVTSIVTLSHMPAAGGTTLGKSLLWKLKDKYKCAVLKNITSYTERQVTQFWESAEEGCDRQKLPPVILLADNLASEESLLTEFELSRRLYRRQMEMQLVRPLAILIRCNQTVKLDGKFQLPQELTEDEKSWMEVKTETLEKEHPEGLGHFIALLAMRNGMDQDFICRAIDQYLDQNVLHENEREVIEYVALITTYFPSSRGLPGLPVTCFDTLMRNFKADGANYLPWEKTLSKVAKVILIIESKSPRIVVTIANQPYAKAVLDTCLRKNSEGLSDIVIRCLKSHLASNASHSRKVVVDLLTQMIIERQFEELSRMTHMSPLIMEIKSTDFDKAVEVLQLGYTTLKNEVFHQQLARLYMSDNQLDKARKCAQQAVELSPEKRDFKHTLGVVYLRQFDAQKSNPANRDNPDERSKLLRVGILALKNFIEAQGKTGDDALSVCFSYAQTIESVNKILQFLLGLIPVERAYKLGLYLVERDYADCELFDCLEETERKTMKTLLIEGIKALRFLFYLAYSNTIAKRDASFQFSKDKRIMETVTKSCEVPMNIFAAGIRQFRLRSDFTSTDENEDNLLRFANVKLKGCFFETIFLKIKVLHSSRGEKKRVISDLLKIQRSLENIHQKSCTDLDNLMTVYLALQIAREKTSFTSNKSKIYGFCNEIIRSSLDHSDTCYMRAHLYRVLVSWPQKYWEGFLEEEFRRSFQHKSPPLQGRCEPLLPKVHFYVTKESESSEFHLCHWTEIYDEAEREPPYDIMSQRLKTFKGDYKLRKNREGEQFSSIEMKWRSAAGELNLTVWKIRGEKVFREECVEFYLGFSLHGPVAIIHSVLGN